MDLIDVCHIYIIEACAYAPTRTPPNKQKKNAEKKQKKNSSFTIYWHTSRRNYKWNAHIHTHTHAIDVVFVFKHNPAAHRKKPKKKIQIWKNRSDKWNLANKKSGSRSIEGSETVTPFIWLIWPFCLLNKNHHIRTKFNLSLPNLFN